MRFTVMVAIVVLAMGMSARAKDKVRVYMEDSSVVPGGVLNQGRLMASEIFAGINVRVEWRTGHPSGVQTEREPVIEISFAEHTPTDYLPGALAAAKVYEGVHITVFWDRLDRRTRAAPAAVVLAHVLVHEITHILQGVDRHSDSGIMKAGWTPSDYVEMSLKPLPFTSVDVELIRRGLAKRTVAITMAGASPNTMN